MLSVKKYIFTSLCFFFTSTVHAGYLELKTDITNNKISLDQLQVYKADPLYPHLLGLWYEQNIKSVSIDAIEKFRNSEPNQAAYWLFKEAWQQEVIRRKNWSLIEREFANETSPELQCHRFIALEKLNRPIPSNTLEVLWNSGLSRPNHCDPYIISWLEAQPNQNELVWQRQLLAFYGRNGLLLRYLNRFYESDSKRSNGDFLAKVYQDPKAIITQGYDPEDTDMRQIALASVNRMAYKDPYSASNLWQRLMKVTPHFTPTEISEASHYLGIAMAKQGLPEANYWLTIADKDRVDAEIQHWRLQIALTNGNLDTVIDLYSQLSPALKNTEQWQYWYGYALLQKNPSEESKENPIYSLSEERSYYGYLAAGLIGVPTQLADDTPYPSSNPNRLKNNASALRAKLLFQLGDVERAQVEWNLWLRDKDPQTQHDAAELAFEWGWYSKSSQAAGWSRRYDLIHLRYPMAYESIIEYHAKLLSIPEFWIYGVIRQESRYMQNAESPAGALGLMQLLPSTAKATAKRYNVDYSNAKDLSDPLTNIALGSHYLSELLKRFDNPVYATAAYNAGPSRVVAWRERYSTNIPIWIESIPFDETRNYVKSVLVYSQVYAITAESGWQMNQWTQQNTGVAELD